MPTTNEVLQQGRYRVISQFELDGTVPVFEAYDNIREANVVLKEISLKLKKVTTVAQLETLKYAFATEAKVLTELKHESLLQVHDFFSEVDRHYLVMEAADGDDLGELLGRNKSPFALTDVADWADRLLDTLNYLHALTPPLIHRDVKPQNVKLTLSGKIKLRAPRIVHHVDADGLSNNGNQTADAASINYLPLEQIWDGLDTASQKVISNSYDERSEKLLLQPLDRRSDIYSLGATLYHMVTAQLPIDALERSIYILEGKPDPLPRPNALDSSIPVEISDVIMKALEIKRENRFDSAAIMRQVLRTAFVRVKEREAEETANDGAREQQEAAMRLQQLEEEKKRVEQQQIASEAEKKQREDKLAEQQRLEAQRKLVEEKRLALEDEEKRLEEEKQLVEKRRLEFENEQKRQTELIAQQEREAEAQRLKAERETEAQKLKAEQEAAEAEKMLLELEVEKPAALGAAVGSQQDRIVTDASNAPNVAEVTAYSAAAGPSIHDSMGDIFSTPAKSGRPQWHMAAAAGIVVLVGGGIFGIWSLMGGSSGAEDQPISNQSIALPETAVPEPSLDPARVTTAEATPETISLPESSNFDSPSEVGSNPSEQKTKAAAPPKAKKPTPARTEQKKPVTVDDLINDN